MTKVFTVTLPSYALTATYLDSKVELHDADSVIVKFEESITPGVICCLIDQESIGGSAVISDRDVDMLR